MAGFKICGLTRLEDVRAAESAGALYGGVILASGSPRQVHPSKVREIFEGSGLRRVGVFVHEDFDLIVSRVDELELDVVQLHGDDDVELAERLRDELGVETWKALRPRDAGEFLAGLERFAGSVDGILLDGWSAAARGGTGTTFPWRAIATLRERVSESMRFIVAGGLSAANVTEAIELLAPDLVDVSSGVESEPGVKDENLIRNFAEAVRAATFREGTE